jgi:RNase H-like domain found in reverse transcriptase/Reverse transcriptase (RNA-dependent DNA polymerase)
MIDNAIKSFSENNVYAYLDNIVIGSETRAKHLETVKNLLSQLVNLGLYGSKEKSQFFKSEMEFLGHVMSSEGIRCTENKVNHLFEKGPLESLKDLQRFLGLANFSRRHIINFSKNASPLYDLLRGSPRRIKYTIEAEEAYSRLCQAYKAPLTIHRVKRDTQQLISTDASGKGIGRILFQTLYDQKRLNQHLKNVGKMTDCTATECIGLYSRLMTDPESRYSTIERELLALLDTLKYFRTAILNSKYPVLILTDHANLEHWNAYKPTLYLNYKWLETLSEFQISVAYIPGEKNILADLSSRPITQKQAIIISKKTNIRIY